MTTKELKEGKCKKAKLAKTRKRREGLARQRRTAEARSRSPRNDLLPALELQQYRISELKPPKHRSRKNDPEQIGRLVRAIADFGFTQPILVREGQVYDGWSRVLAARELGLDEVPAIECSHLDDAEARALALAINRIGERGDWDLDELRLEFIDLAEFEIDLDSTGFTIEEQDIILIDPADEEAGGSELDEVEEPPEKPTSRLSDVWLMDGHRVICGSALEEESYRTLLEDDEVQAVLTDPPYNVKIEGNVSGLGKKVHDEFVMASGEMTDTEFEAFLGSVLALITMFLAAGAVVFAFMDWRSIHRLYRAGEKAKLNLINLAVWYKQSGGMGALYRSAHELVAVFCNGKTPRHNAVKLGKNGRDRCNVWEAPGANRRGSSANAMRGLHATPKPLSICEDAILDVTGRGEIVLDAFLGSGTTLAACEKTGRLCRGIELDPRFVDVSVRRWEALTGKEAVLAETGESFAEVVRRRSAEQLDASEPAGHDVAREDQGGEA